MPSHRLSTLDEPRTRSGAVALASVCSLVAVCLIALLNLTGGPAAAAATAVDLGTADTFGVLAGSEVTNSGPSVIAGDLGVSPGTAVSGFPPGTVLGTVHSANAAAGQAQSDLKIAYDAAAGQPTSETISADLAGRTLTTGVYTAATTMGLTGELTLDAEGDPTATFVFQVGSKLTTASGSDITLTNGAQACNVYWQVGSSATLGTGSTFVGTILALTSISATTGASIDGRLLARNGAVTLDSNQISRSTCTTVPSTGGPATGGPTTGGPATGGPTTGGPATGGPATGGPADNVPADDVSSTALPVVGPGTSGTPGQVQDVPVGHADTGTGGAVRGLDRTLSMAGLLALLMSAGSLVWWRREVARG